MPKTVRRSESVFSFWVTQSPPGRSSKKSGAKKKATAPFRHSEMESYTSGCPAAGLGKTKVSLAARETAKSRRGVGLGRTGGARRMCAGFRLVCCAVARKGGNERRNARPVKPTRSVPGSTAPRVLLGSTCHVPTSFQEKCSPLHLFHCCRLRIVQKLQREREDPSDVAAFSEKVSQHFISTDALP